MQETVPQKAGQTEGLTHATRTAKVVELVGSSTKGFEDAVQTVIEDANNTTRGITGAEVENFNVKCENGRICEYRATVKVAFGVERNA